MTTEQPTPDRTPQDYFKGPFGDPNWVPPLAGTLRLGADQAVGPWGFQRPAPPAASRPLRDQFLRTYPNRAFPVRLGSAEAYQFSSACSDYQRQMRESDPV